jgi:hypothetical protein
MVSRHPGRVIVAVARDPAALLVVGSTPGVVIEVIAVATLLVMSLDRRRRQASVGACSSARISSEYGAGR